MQVRPVNVFGHGYSYLFHGYILQVMESMHGRKGILFGISTRPGAHKEARTRIMYIMYVHAHGRLGVIFIYVLSKVACFHIGSLPVELNKRRHVGQRRSFISKDSTKREIRFHVF